MRIVYDDTKATTMIKVLADFMTHHLSVKSIVRPDYGMNRVQRSELKEQLSYFIADYDLSIGDTVTHAYGIGNNCRYPVYYKAENELQQCCSLNINVDPFGKGYVTLEDHNGTIISDSYRILYAYPAGWYIHIEKKEVYKNDKH